MPTKIHGPHGTVTIGDQEFGKYDKEIDIRDIDWEDAYQKFLESDADENGWMDMYLWGQNIADRYTLWDIPGYCCVELAVQTGILERGLNGTAKPRYNERVQLDVSDEFEARDEEGRIELRI